MFNRKRLEDMKSETKDGIQYASAIGMLIFGAALCTAGIILPPLGQIHSSVLAVLGQCVLFAGAVFGLKAYIDTAISKHLRGEDK